jgi:hypothetical protein
MLSFHLGLCFTLSLPFPVSMKFDTFSNFRLIAELFKPSFFEIVKRLSKNSFSPKKFRSKIVDFLCKYFLWNSISSYTEFRTENNTKFILFCLNDLLCFGFRCLHTQIEGWFALPSLLSLCHQTWIQFSCRRLLNAKKVSSTDENQIHFALIGCLSLVRFSVMW